jgi:ribosomal protein L29
VVVFLILLVVYLLALGTFAFQNYAPPHQVTFLVWHPYVADWMPTAIAAAGLLALMVLWGGYGRIRSGFARRGLHRRINAHEASISELGSENDRLKGELAGLRGQLQVALRERQEAVSEAKRAVARPPAAPPSAVQVAASRLPSAPPILESEVQPRDRKLGPFL